MLFSPQNVTLPKNPKVHGPVFNHGFCDIAARVATAASNLFRAIGQGFVEAGSWLKDRVIDFFEPIAELCDARRIFVRTILGVAAGERAAVLQCALPHISPQMDQNAKEQLIQLVNNEDLAHPLSKSMLQFITPDMHSPDSIEMTQVIAALPAEQRDAVIAYANRFTTERGMFWSSRRAIIEAVTAIPVQEREEVIRNAVLLIEPNMSTSSKIDMIEAVFRIPTNERDVVRTLQAITQGLNTFWKNAIIRAVTDIPVQEREEVARNAVLLIRPTELALSKIDMIRAVFLIPSNERNVATALALLVITQDMSTHGREMILKTILKLPAREREEVVRNAVRLIAPESNWSDRICMILDMARIPSNERDGVRALALQAITQNMGAYERETILGTIALLPPLERSNVMQHALQLIDAQMDMDYLCKVAIIRNIANLPADQRANFSFFTNR